MVLNCLGASWKEGLKECGGDTVGAGQRGDSLSCKVIYSKSHDDYHCIFYPDDLVALHVFITSPFWITCFSGERLL